MKCGFMSRATTERLARRAPAEQARLIRSLSPEELLAYDAEWESWAMTGQRPPCGEGWRTWLMLAGRGYGKTRAGAEWICRLATAGTPVRIALVGATAAEVRAVMIEGESGILAASVGRPRSWEPSLGRLRWRNGSVAFVYSGENPDGLRGPSHHFAWCDELAKWARPEETWDNLQMTLRGGERPRALVTTTPRPIPLLKRIRAEPWTVETGGRTRDNKHLPEAFVEAMSATYGGTRLGRQELDGALIEDVEGSLWPRGLIEKCRAAPILPGERCSAGLRAPSTTAFGGGPPPRPGEDHFRRIVVGVDPPASVGGDACGIVVCALGADEVGYVLEDASVSGMRPEGWARAVAAAAEKWGADRVVAEANQGGAMVESVLRSAEVNLPVRLVHASRGKVARAEPVATLFERGRAKFAGAFPELEDELAGLTIGGGYEGPGRSPDRADAMVWALTELMPAKKRAEPRARFL